MKIREAIPEDAGTISQLARSLSHYYLTAPNDIVPGWLDASITQQAFQKRIADPEFDHFVCVKDGQIIGYISIKNRSHLHHLFVSEAHHNKGISRKLWQQVKDKCQSQQYTLRSSLYAVPVYEKFGFKKSQPVAEKDGLFFQPMELND